MGNPQSHGNLIHIQLPFVELAEHFSSQRGIEDLHQIAAAIMFKQDDVTLHRDRLYQNFFWYKLSGAARGLASATDLPQRITVPFCPESLLSGIGHTDFIPAVWYQRTIYIPADWEGKSGCCSCSPCSRCPSSSYGQWGAKFQLKTISRSFTTATAI